MISFIYLSWFHFSSKTQLFWRNRKHDDLDNIFYNPRTHIGAGYYRQHANGLWLPLSPSGLQNEECDDAKRWRYIHAATEFCNESIANQIAVLCNLWDKLRFIPDGNVNAKERFVRFDNQTKSEIESLFGPVNFCNDVNEESCRCKCTERAGSWCSLMKVLGKVANVTEGVEGFFPKDKTISSMDDIVNVSNCPCEEGIEFTNIHSEILLKLERQLFSFPRNIRRELLIWFLGKHMHNYEPFVYAPDRDPKVFLLAKEYCNNEILACHYDYGEMMYSNGAKGCKCHGI